MQVTRIVKHLFGSRAVRLTSSKCSPLFPQYPSREQTSRIDGNGPMLSKKSAPL